MFDTSSKESFLTKWCNMCIPRFLESLIRLYSFVESVMKGPKQQFDDLDNDTQRNAGFITMALSSFTPRKTTMVHFFFHFALKES